MSYWDLIVRLCYLSGAIPYFQGAVLIIRPVFSIFDQQRAGVDPRIRTPFLPDQRREVPSEGDGPAIGPFAVRRLVYGRDVTSFSFERKFGGQARPKTVRCVSTNQSSTTRGVRRVVEGRYPPDQSDSRTQAARTHVRSVNGRQAQEEVQFIPVYGIRDVRHLTRMARAIYEEMGRGEQGGSCETKNLTSFGGTNQDPDLLRLRPGDGIEFYTDVTSLRSRAPIVSTLTDHERTSFEEQVAIIKARIGNENLARAIVATSRGNVVDIQRFFRVSNVKYTWDTNSGVSVGFDFQNFLVIRNELDRNDTPTAAGRSNDQTVPRETTPRATANTRPRRST